MTEDKQKVKKLIVYGASWCPDCHRSLTFLDEHQIAYDWMNIEEVPEAADLVVKLNNGMRIIPTIVFPDGSSMAEPSNKDLEEKLIVAGVLDLADKQ